MKANRDFLTPDRPAWIRTGATISLDLHVQPGARRSAVIGEHGARLKIAVDAPPLDGHANDAVIALIATQLGVRPSALRVASGQHSRDKRIELAAGTLGVDEIVARLRPK